MYKFTKIDKDTTRLECEIDGELKQFEIKRTVELLKELTSATHKSRNRLIKEIKKDGKTYYDNSSWNELENNYYEEENQRILSEIIEKVTGYDLVSLIMGIGLKEDEMEKFTTELVLALTGSKSETPSQKA